MGLAASIVLGVAPTLPPPPIEVSPHDEMHAADYTLVWNAPASCPSAAQIEARVAALRTTEPGGDGVIDIRAYVVKDGDMHRLELTTEYREYSETRELAARECAELGEAVALVVAFALAPEPGEHPDVFEPEPTPLPEPHADVTPEPTALGDSGLGFAYLAAEEGTHELAAPADVGFEVTAYGYADDGSYVFAGGVGLQVLNPAG